MKEPDSQAPAKRRKRCKNCGELYGANGPYVICAGCSGSRRKSCPGCGELFNGKAFVKLCVGCMKRAAHSPPRFEDGRVFVVSLKGSLSLAERMALGLSAPTPGGFYQVIDAARFKAVAPAGEFKRIRFSARLIDAALRAEMDRKADAERKRRGYKPKKLRLNRASGRVVA